MFDYKGSKSIFNKAEVEKIIIEGDNITIAYKEGYEENGKFVSVGADHVDFKDDAFTEAYFISPENKESVCKRYIEKYKTRKEENETINSLQDITSNSDLQKDR